MTRKSIAEALVDRSDRLAWLKYRSNAQTEDLRLQLRYARAAALLLLGQDSAAVVEMLECNRDEESTDWQWSIQRCKEIASLDN